LTFSNFFSDYLANIEWLDALIGAVVLLALGYLWYGPLFGKQTGMDGESSDPMTIGKGFVKFFLFGLGIGAVFPAVHVVFQNAPTFETLLVTSFAVTLFVTGMPLLSEYVWGDGKFDRWLIDWGFWFVGAFAYGYVVLDLLA
jgi:hypothetical protein